MATIPFDPISMPFDPASRYLFARSRPHGPVVLMYHSICSTDSGKSRWVVPIKRFQQQLDLLQSYGWETLCVRELYERPSLRPHTVAITFDDGYADNFAAFEQLVERQMHATWFVVSRDIGKFSTWHNPEMLASPMLSEEQIRTMNRAGMEIGSHTRTHCRLKEVDAQPLRDEVEISKAELERILGRPVESFAYPYGVYDDRTVEAVRQAGYRAACTTRTGWALRDHDPLRIRRVAVYGRDSLSAFARKLVFADNDVSWQRVVGYFSSRALTRLSLASPKA